MYNHVASSTFKFAQGSDLKGEFEMSAIQYLAQTAPAVVTPPAATSWLSGPLVIAVALATVISLILIYRSVKNASHWSISDALSEETEIATPIFDPATNLPLRDANGAVITSQQMRASSSRLIALLGSVAIMMLYIGAGLIVLGSFAAGTGIPKDTDKFAQFFLYGMVLFAPYVVNKFASIFGWLK